MQHTAWPCMATTPTPLQKDTSPFANMSYLFCPILRAWASACLPDMLAGATRRESRGGGGERGGHDQLLANMLTHSAPEINSYTIMGVFTTYGVLKTECVIIYIMNSSSQKKTLIFKMFPIMFSILHRDIFYLLSQIPWVTKGLILDLV